MKGDKNITNATSVSVGTMFYRNNGAKSGGHAINVFLSEKKKLIYFEPEAGSFYKFKHKNRERKHMVRKLLIKLFGIKTFERL